MSAPIFISYSSKDREIAETICQALEARGQNCWIACRNVRAGENFQEAIVRALRQARVMLLVFSSNANNSDEIKKELVLAGRHHVTVVPARVDDVVPGDAFTYELATRQWIDLFRNWEQAIEQLSSQLDDILRTAKPEEGKADVALPLPPRHRVGPKRANNYALIAAIALLLLLIAGGALFLLKPGAGPAPVTPPAIAQAVPPVSPSQAHPPQAAAPQEQAMPQKAQTAPAASVRTAMARESRHQESQIVPPQSAAPVQPVAPPAAAPAPAPIPPAAAPAQDPDEAAWQAANSDGTAAGFSRYLKGFATGQHAQEAQLRLADLILKSPATGANFDGSWQTVWTCPNLGPYPGYSYQFTGEVRDGIYHGIRGVKGQPSSIVLDGKVEADGTAAFFGEIVVGSSLAGMGAARGTPSDFHALAQLDHGSGSGRRLEGRACSLSFQKG